MLNMRKLSRSVPALLLPVILCFAPAPAVADDVVVFAAASLTNALGDIARGYEPPAKDKVSFSFASSSTLAKQIENGAPANVFISADLDWMDYLEKLKLIAPGSRSDLLGNRLVLIAPKDSDVAVSLAAGVDLVPLLKGGLLATGDPDHVPVGKYAKAAALKPFILPGLLLQKITTKEPSLDQIEVAIAALEASLGTTDSRVTSKVTALS